MKSCGMIQLVTETNGVVLSWDKCLGRALLGGRRMGGQSSGAHRGRGDQSDEDADVARVAAAQCASARRRAVRSAAHALPLVAAAHGASARRARKT